MEEPAAPAAVAAATPKYLLEPVDGGVLPDLGALLNETMSEFMDHIGPYALAGLGLYVVVVPVTMILFFGMYFLMFGGVFGVAIVGGILSVIVGDAAGEGAGALVALASQLVGMGVMFLAFVAVIAAVVGIFAPLSASLTRAVAAHQRGEKTLDFSAAFSTLMQDLPRVIGVGVIIGGLTMLGIFMCYAPALLVAVFLGFASSLVYLHRARPGEAIRNAFGHARSHLQWHGTFALVVVALSFVAGNVPVLGPMFIIAMQVRAYRQLFGDGPEPVYQLR